MMYACVCVRARAPNAMLVFFKCAVMLGVRHMKSINNHLRTTFTVSLLSRFTCVLRDRVRNR